MKVWHRSARTAHRCNAAAHIYRHGWRWRDRVCKERVEVVVISQSSENRASRPRLRASLTGLCDAPMRNASPKEPLQPLRRLLLGTSLTKRLLALCTPP